MILDGVSDPYASEFLFIGTDVGVYSFNRNTETWGRITTANGLPGNQVRVLGLDEGILWVGTDNGLASADVRINDWQTYDIAGTVEALAFDPDHAWVAGDSGILRFDKYTEEWQRVADAAVLDMLLDQEHLWLAAGSGVRRYNIGLERVEEVAAPAGKYERIIETPGRIWFAGPGRVVGYDQDNETWSEYPGIGFDDYAVFGDSVFLASDNKVKLYDPKSDKWLQFRDVELVEGVRGVGVGSGSLLAVLEDRVLSYDLNEGTQTWYTEARGLDPDSLVDAFQDKGFVYAVGAGSIQFLDKGTEIWQSEPLVEPGEKREQLVYLDEAGAHLRLVPETDVRLSGRAYYSETRNFTKDTMTLTDFENINLNLVALHESGRSFSAFYDDSDQDQVLYGAGFRGKDQDLLQRANGGYLESEYFEFDLLPGFSTLGANARLRHEAVGLDLQGGRLQSMPRSSFFFGRTAEQERSIQDIGYARNVFYNVFSPARPVERGADTIFVDDGNPATNSVDTRLGYLVGGIKGDFDPLIHGIDYAADFDQGLVQFLVKVESTDVVVMKLNSHEVVLQSDSVSGKDLENVYLVGPGIIPGSFEVAIFDTLGQEHALSEFGLDDDRDRKVDPEFLNHDLGYLRFAEERPFPEQVYESRTNVYTMDTRYRTRSTFFRLTHVPILKASELVLVDGEAKARGSEYVIDYTSGNLLFLEEDLVSDFSEVEVYYSSVERESEAVMVSAQSNVRVADGLNFAPGFSRVDEENVFHASARVEQEWGGKRSIRLVPQAAVDHELGWAQKHELVGNYGIAGISAVYQGYSEQFNGFGATGRKHGDLRHSGLVSGALEPLAHVRVDGQFRKEWQEDSADTQFTVQYAWGKLSYLNPSLPQVYVLAGDDRLPGFGKQRLKAGAGYEFDALQSKFKLNGSLLGEEMRPEQEDKERLLEYVADLGFRLPFAVHGNVFVRSNSLDGAAAKGEQETRARLNVDVVPGVYYAGTYDQDAVEYDLGPAKDLVLDQYFYNNLHFAPGRWWSSFSVINLSFGLGSSFSQYSTGLPVGFRRPALVFEPVRSGDISSITKSDNWSGTVQLLPLTELLVWFRHSETRGGTGRFGIPEPRLTRQDKVNVEFEPGQAGRFAGIWEMRNTHNYPAEASQNWFLEWTMPWTDVVRTKLTTSYWLKDNDYVVAQTRDQEVKANAEALFRLGSKSFITFHAGGNRKQDWEQGVSYEVVPGAGFNLNLLGFLYLQADFESVFLLGGSPTHQASSRITAQF
ncbi:MAG: hypothetical protein JSU73_07190 [candidate division WOR-3 bacterium]|nr:MAG: hypothetical protein JSU73_07190 [candidate division WOR-3 bacterium]